MKNAIRNLIFLIALFCCRLEAQTPGCVNLVFNLQDFIGNPQAVQRLILVPLPSSGVGILGSNLLIPVSNSVPTGLGGNVTISNVVTGYAYLMQLQDQSQPPNTIGQWTNYVPTNVTGTVNATNYLGYSASAVFGWVFASSNYATVSPTNGVQFITNNGVLYIGATGIDGVTNVPANTNQLVLVTNTDGNLTFSNLVSTNGGGGSVALPITNSYLASNSTTSQMTNTNATFIGTVSASNAINAASVSGVGLGVTNTVVPFHYAALNGRNGGNSTYISTADTWQTAPGGWGTSTNNFIWLTNCMRVWRSYDPTHFCRDVMLTDYTVTNRDANGNFIFNTNVTGPLGITNLQAIAASYDYTLDIYTTQGGLTAGGNTGSDTNHIYRDTLNICTNGLGFYIATDSANGSNSYYTETFLSLIDQAVDAWNSNSTGNLGPMYYPHLLVSGANPLNNTGPPGSLFTQISSALFEASPAISISPTNTIGNALYADVASYMPLFQNPKQVGEYHHFLVVEQSAGVGDTNCISLQRLSGSFTGFYAGYYADPYFATNGAHPSLAQVNYQMLNSNLLETYKDGANVCASIFYNVTNTWIVSCPITAGAFNGGILVGLFNTNVGVASMPIYWTNFGGLSNVLYSCIELYSSNIVSNFYGGFNFTMAPGVNLFEIGPYVTPLGGNPNSNVVTIGGGSGVSLTTGQYDVFCGNNSGLMATSATGDVYVGFGAGYFDNGSYNVAVGYEALTGQNGTQTGFNDVALGSYALTSITSGLNDIAIGQSSLYYLTTGQGNIAIGSYGSGINYTGNESSNILIGNSGVTGDMGTIRIGTVGTHANTFIAGVINGNAGGFTNLNASSFTGGTTALTNDEVSPTTLSNYLSIITTGNAASLTASNGALSGNKIAFNALGPNGLIDFQASASGLQWDNGQGSTDGGGNITSSGFVGTNRNVAAFTGNASGLTNIPASGLQSGQVNTVLGSNSYTGNVNLTNLNANIVNATNALQINGTSVLTTLANQGTAITNATQPTNLNLTLLSTNNAVNLTNLNPANLVGPSNGYVWLTPFHGWYHTNFYATNVANTKIYVWTNNSPGTNMVWGICVVNAYCPVNLANAHYGRQVAQLWVSNGATGASGVTSIVNPNGNSGYPTVNADLTPSFYFQSAAGDTTNYWKIEASVELNLNP